MKRYGFCFGIGSACSCSQVLRAAKLQLASFPFDWIAANAGICPRADLIAGRFRDWMELSDLEIVPSPEWHDKEFVRNRRIGHVQNHDFPKGVPIEESYPSVRAKYDRRIMRLDRCIRNAGVRGVLIACLDLPIDGGVQTSIEDCRSVLRRMEECYPDCRFDFLLINFKPGHVGAPLEEILDGGRITRLEFDYKDRSPGSEDYSVRIGEVADVLSSRYAVEDYRTRAERAAERARRRARRMGVPGQVGWLAYRIFRLREGLIDFAEKNSPRILLARLRRRKFDHFISLGVNCEVAFRFQLKWGFLDSSLFAWAQGYSLSNLIDVLGRLEDLCAGEMVQLPVSDMWRCKNTGMSFHGKLARKPGCRPPNAAERAADCEDLRGRIRHLREKFLAYLRDENSTLLVYRINRSECGDDVGVKLTALQVELERLGARNYVLLVVTEGDCLKRIPPAPHREVRSVRKFNPMDKVTEAQLGDTVGWNAVFTEFAPSRIQAKKHAFKFER